MSVSTTLTARALNRTTLARQLLLQREPVSVVDALRRVVALQAQEPASPYLALWNRMAGFDAAELDRAFAAQAVVKGTSMRGTLHAALPEDHWRFHEAMQPTLQASRLNDERFKRVGLTAAEVDALLPEVLAYLGEPRTNADMDAWFERRLGVLEPPGPWWAIRSYAPVVHGPTGGPWSFGPRPAHVAARNRDGRADADTSLQHLVRRYLEGFGPASVADVARFSSIPRVRVRAAIDDLGDSVVHVPGPAKEPLFDVAGGPLTLEEAPAPPRLLGMWDEVLLAYADRSRIVPEPYRREIIRVNGDLLPTLLVDGYVAGVWRAVDDGIEAMAFHPLEDEAWGGLEAEARTLLAFLEPRDPLVFRRYGHWWTKLPEGTVRVLGR